jgi:tyrosyl-tRNA synthetase
MNGLEFARLLTHYTATRLLERDDFSQRIKDKKPLYMHELIYPILQGYDSVVLEADVELGGTDQRFNLLVGRDIQKDYGKSEQVVITMPLLEGTDGVAKMSKSYGNYIGIDESPDEIFGKVMSISDELMFKYYTLLTDFDLEEVKVLHPKEAKVRLAESIVSQYHSEKEAAQAAVSFQNVFAEGLAPEDAPVFKIDPSASDIISVLTKSGVIPSKNEARRLVQQGGVSLDGKRIDSEDAVMESGILKIGKRRFLKLTR